MNAGRTAEATWTGQELTAYKRSVGRSAVPGSHHPTAVPEIQRIGVL